MAKALTIFKSFVYQGEASTGSQCWAWGAARASHPSDFSHERPLGAPSSQSMPSKSPG